MIKKISFLLSILFFGSIFGQNTKEQLQKQNADIKKQIANINADLAKTKNESKLSLAYLNAVNQKISLREKSYNNTQKEKRFIEDDIYRSQLEINKNKRELSKLRKDYAEILVKAYKNKGVQNKVTFILSSKNIGEALRRIQYLKQYSEYQDRKAAEITNKATEIQKNIAKKQQSVNEKDKLLINQKKELATIEVERKQKEDLLVEFKKNETQLTTELKQKQAQQRSLEGQIRAIINEEIRAAKAKAEAEKKAEEERKRQALIAAAKEKARIDAENKAKAEALEKERKALEEETRKARELAAKKAADEKKRADEAAKAETDAKAEARRILAERESNDAKARAKAAEERLAAAKAAEAALNKKKEEEKKEAETKTMKAFGVGSVTAGSNFAESKGRIGFPVERGNITHRFGRQQHPVFKNIWEENNGIKIAVSPGSKARCVFPGVVSTIIVDGGTKTVMVKHGNYFTVYSNLSNVNVKSNQTVSAGTQIGEITTSLDGSYTLDFQIWNGTSPVDPMGWVSY
ncbi:peptidoglycan DD-metalloendopeptidase family protein [Chryseobacterium sp. POL2]|uniref:murein hydrolase activator EnvC family protein n=1 Tax=Chryseobacterium sp. POL2 TaxID=2713414 RepID=UPI0013E16B72|nr:peptidoglycan DD-metalloendopeptidase family protein [Chryseobacterium sp. POL2]QIG89769.1 peptidoglycan DD-metalloendopeptidase family protein [Chryseobacterium sp. POL2]